MAISSDIDRDKKLLLEYECVLDLHHKTLQLWEIDRGEAVFASLARFDIEMIVRQELMALLDDQSVGGAQEYKGQQEGLSQALEWLTDQGRNVVVTPIVSTNTLGQSRSFCDFAKIYVDIADFHKMYWRGQLSISANEQRRSIRFVWNEKTDRNQTIRGFENRSWERTKLREIGDQQSPEQIRNQIGPSLKACAALVKDGRIVLENPSPEAIRPFATLANLFQFVEYDFIEDSVDFVGFTAGDFQLYFQFLRAWSLAIQCAFKIHCTSYPDDLKYSRVVPTQFYDYQEFNSRVADGTGIAREVVQRITERISYGEGSEGNSTPSLYLQPLLAFDDTLAWSPSIVASSSYLRNMLKLMARTASLRNHAATVIGDRERLMLRKLGGWFQQRGRSAYKLMKYVQADGEATDIDLLVYNSKFPSEVLLIEGKALLAPDEINEVDTATEEMKKGQLQLEVAMRILANLSIEQKKAIYPFVEWALVKQVFGLVVTPNSEPHQGFDRSVMPAISMATIHSQMRDNHFASPKKFYDRTLARPWREQQRTYVEQYRIHAVGNVVYELPYGTTVEPFHELMDS